MKMIILFVLLISFIITSQEHTHFYKWWRFTTGSAGEFGSGNNIRVGLSNFSAILIERYVCCECGYSQEWINKKNINSLKKKYQMYK